jgi:hypothetical protein
MFGAIVSYDILFLKCSCDWEKQENFIVCDIFFLNLPLLNITFRATELSKPEAHGVSAWVMAP